MKTKIQNKYKRYIILIFIFGFLLIKNISFAEECSKDGYTVLVINGVLTNDDGAKQNMRALKESLTFNGDYFNNQKITVNYLLNPSHGGGVLDLKDAIAQGDFDQKSDYDLTNILLDASQKITTQKVLVVGHSQGNFYANNFYDTVTRQAFGIPNQSIGVYAIATPANHISGVYYPNQNNYMNSSTDNVIYGLAGNVFQNRLKPNTDIKEVKSWVNPVAGHDLILVYLTYRPVQIVRGIQSSLNKLQTNNIQNTKVPCMNAPVIDDNFINKGAVLSLLDNPIDSGINGANIVIGLLGSGIYNTSLAIGNIAKKATSTVASAIMSIAQLPFSNTKSLVADNDTTINNSENQSVDTTQNTVPESTQENSNSTVADTVAGAEATPPPQAEVSAPVEASLPQTPQPSQSPQEIILTPATGGSSVGGTSSSSTPQTPTDEQTQENSSNTDTVPPVISIIGDDLVEVTKDTSYTDSGASALDAVDGDLTSSIVKSGTFVDTTTVGTYTIIYTVKDLSNNIATKTRTVNVVAPFPLPDTTIPIITLLGGSTVSVMRGETYSDAGATAIDDVDGDISSRIVTVNPVNTNTIGDYTITYNVKDVALNSATEVERLVHVEVPPLTTFTIDQNTTLAPGEYNYDNLIITNNAILTLKGNLDSTDPFKGVKINAVNITIDNGASISADQQGYGPNAGPGISSIGSTGASYGGISISGLATSTYGSATKPVDLGSGGASTNYGGGAIHLVVSDTFINNGIISADGGQSSSGGSIYITAKNITGNGMLHANGGYLYGSGYFKSPGGGGRVALYYETSSFNGTIEAKGGCGSYDSYSQVCADNGTVGIFDKVSNNLYLNGSWKFLQNDAPFSFNNIFISNGAKVTSENNVSITANNLLLDKNSFFTLADNQILNIPTITVDGGSTLTLSGIETITANTINLTGSSTINVIPGKILSLTIPNISVSAGSFISADARGHGPNTGPGISVTDNAGASYGGAGYGNLANTTYGSETEPTDFGSGGVTYGGGAIRIIVSGTFNNDGIVSADGGFSSSGGSVFVTADNITGNGTFRGNGGGLYASGYFKGPGGGGRVALHYETSSFSGTVETKGGCGSYDGYSASCGKNGTVKTIDTSVVVPESESEPDPVPDPVIDPDVPSLVSAKVTSSSTVDLTFSLDLDGRTVTNNDFAITGYTLTSPDAFEVTPGVVQLTISGTFTSGETPEIIYNTTVSNGVKILAGNLVPSKTIIANSL